MIIKIFKNVKVYGVMAFYGSEQTVVKNQFEANVIIFPFSHVTEIDIVPKHEFKLFYWPI